MITNLVNTIAQMSVQEFNEFRRLLQTRLGMSILTGDVPDTLYNVWLTERSEFSIQAIKTLRGAFLDKEGRYGLKEAKDAIDLLPVRNRYNEFSEGQKVVVESEVTFEEADALTAKLRGSGHLTVEIRPVVYTS